MPLDRHAMRIESEIFALSAEPMRVKKTITTMPPANHSGLAAYQSVHQWKARGSTGQLISLLETSRTWLVNSWLGLRWTAKMRRCGTLPRATGNKQFAAAKRNSRCVPAWTCALPLAQASRTARRLHAGIGYHRVRLRQPDRSVSVAPAVDAAQHAGVDLEADADIVVLIAAQRGDAARPVAVIGPKP